MVTPRRTISSVSGASSTMRAMSRPRIQTAAIVYHNRNPRTIKFEVRPRVLSSAGCSGFLDALTVGGQFVESGAHDKVVVVGADVMSSITNPDDRSTCVLFGDAAGAVLLEPSEDEEFGILDYLHEVDGSGGDFLYMPAGGSLHPASYETVDKKMHYVH